MKQIRVNSVIPPDATSSYSAHHTYYVTLGNRRRVAFSSRRDAKAFQAATEQFLNGVLHEVNAMLGQALHDYRMAWPALHHTARTMSSEAIMQECLSAAGDALDRAAAGSQGPNRMHFAWKHLTDANQSVLRFHTELARWYQYKTQGVWRHQALIAVRRCEGIAERLNDYGATGQ